MIFEREAVADERPIMRDALRRSREVLGVALGSQTLGIGCTVTLSTSLKQHVFGKNATLCYCVVYRGVAYFLTEEKGWFCGSVRGSQERVQVRSCVNFCSKGGVSKLRRS
jgi:hypothetical protein